LWQSDSVTGTLPPTEIRPIGDWYFESVNAGDHSNEQIALHRLQLSTAWEFDDGQELPFIVHVVDQADSLTRQLQQFDRTLWASLLISAIALLFVQLLVLKYSLKPLVVIGSEVAEIEKGDRDELSESVPKELTGLASGLNALLRAERQRHEQYRHLLGDLSHNLKTPLTVLRNLGSSTKSLNSKVSESIFEQTSLMETSLQRYSQRASSRTPRYLAPLLSAKPFLQRITSSLDKLYKTPGIDFSIKVADDFNVRIDAADLLEVLGNILENACKYGATNVQIVSDEHQRTLTVDDNGPGFPAGDLQRLKQRGVRADSETPGSGMGLAAVQQILGNYGGSLDLDHSPLGGARIVLRLP
jgi:two-component system sensor histidine kinase PhoQ